MSNFEIEFYLSFSIHVPTKQGLLLSPHKLTRIVYLMLKLIKILTMRVTNLLQWTQTQVLQNIHQKKGCT